MRITWLLVVLLLAGCGDGPHDDAAENDLADAGRRAQEALQPLKQRLMGELTQASADGPENAIDVCRVKAPAIAAALSVGGIRVGRTSHRLRNPANAPASWMEPLLASYRDDPNLRTHRAVRLDDGGVGYVEPIYVKPLCLTCHGKTLSPSVSEKINTLYPEDQAVGFEEGDFRGLFWVTMPAQGP